MKKHSRFFMIGLTSVLLAGSAYAVAKEPGTTNDPLVTKSYVDQKISALKGQSSGSGSTNSLEKEIAELSLEMEILTQEMDKLRTEKSSAYEVVTVPQGNSIFGKQGTEMIVRSGEGVVLASQGGGLQDMTEGTDLNDQSSVPKFHLIIIPREDGRGLYANKELIVMVRGGYTIQ